MNTKTSNQKQPLSAISIAKYFLWKANKEHKKITNKKLQKLLYYAQAWHLVFEDEPLFKEPIEAWIHGPAIKIIYDKYKKFGFNPIVETVSGNDIALVPDKKLLDEIWRVYGKYDAEYLETLSHNELPWQNARENLERDQNSSIAIDLQEMKEYYGNRLKRK